MRVYSGERLPSGKALVTVSRDGAIEQLLPDRSQRIRNHSPDGFQWGYGGSGPAQLALALLLDATNDEDLAQDWYQTFKWAHVATWKVEWSITDADIRQWLADEQFADLRTGERHEKHRTEDATEAR